MSTRPTLAVWKFASCDGCQLTLLDCEDELLEVAAEIEVAHFLEASRATVEGPYDLSLVEGSITTPADAERILQIRRASRHLVSIGACATAGGIQALRNFADVRQYLAAVYATPSFISTLATSTPLSAHIAVDFELRGCPIDPAQLLEVVSAFLNRRRPTVGPHSVCLECKMQGNVCVMVAHGTPCLGPITHAGCGALCPAHHSGCYGCFGPAEDPNQRSLSAELTALGETDVDLVRMLRTFNAAALPSRPRAPGWRSPGRGRPMTDEPSTTRTLHVGALARVAGEGAMHVEIRDGQVREVQLQIYEPPRFFEAFLRGRGHHEPPDLTARICGICPVAYQMSACNAIEAACGVVVDGPIADLRRLLYCGEWIESHTLHVYMLHAPDFMGYPGAIEMARDHRPIVERGLRLKKAGNAILRLIGGRPIHPVNVTIGGFFRAPTVRELESLRPALEQARTDALATVDWVSAFSFPELESDHALVALRAHDEYPMGGGRLVSTGGLDIGPDDFPDHVTEEQVAPSTALHAHLGDGNPYLLGPLARFALNAGALRPVARDAARAAGIGPGLRNPYQSIVVRAVEVLQACDDALALIERYQPPDPSAVPVEPRAWVGCGWSEAPRGLLWHRYQLDADGTILQADIVPPTSQNQAAIEDDLLHLVEQEIDRPDDELRHRAEQLIRSYDPCISCSTHFLDLTVDRA